MAAALLSSCAPSPEVETAEIEPEVAETVVPINEASQETEIEEQPAASPVEVAEPQAAAEATHEEDHHDHDHERDDHDHEHEEHDHDHGEHDHADDAVGGEAHVHG